MLFALILNFEFYILNFKPYLCHMTLQTIIVYLIGVAVVVWLAVAIVRGYRARKYTKCSGCSDKECPYHNSTDERQCPSSKK